MNLAKAARLFIIIIGSGIILVWGKDLLIPFVLSVILWFIIKEVRNGLLKIKWVRKYFPFWLQSMLSALIILLVILVIVNLLGNNIQQLSQKLPTYEPNLEKFGNMINQQFNIDILAEVQKFMGEFDFSNMLGSFFNGLSELFGNAFLIVLYVLFLMMEETTFTRKLDAMYTDPEELAKTKKMLAKIDHSMGSYFALKSLVSVLTGVLSYFALLIIGVEAAVFWAFLIFILNYIPTIGSLIATIFPAIFAIFQFGELQPFLLVLVIVGIIQLIIGNLVEPKLMGNSLNISTFVVMLTLSLWGIIWGVAGMLLSVPITVIMIIIFAEFKETRPVAIMLSEKGKV